MSKSATSTHGTVVIVCAEQPNSLVEFWSRPQLHHLQLVRRLVITVENRFPINFIALRYSYLEA